MSLTPVFALGGAMAAGAVALQAYRWYVDEAWLPLALLAGGFLAGIPGLVWLVQRVRRLARRPVYDRRLVQEKLSRPAFRAELRLAVFAPVACPRAAVEARLDHLAAAYRQFNLAAGNGFVPRPLRLPPAQEGRPYPLSSLDPLLPRRAVPLLTTREVAGLWHLPQAQADVPLVERTTARERLPLPDTVASGCRLGVSRHQGRTVPVSLPHEVLRRHLLLVAKTRRGKSSVLARLARHLMETPAATGAAGRPGALVLVDPHRDLAQAVLGLVPPRRRSEVV